MHGPWLPVRAQLAAVILGAVAYTSLTWPAHAAEPHILNLAVIGPGVTCTEALAKGANTVAGAVADGSQGIVLCAHVEDAATNTDQGGIPVIFTASVGTVGATGTTKSTTVLTSASGVTSISYRGAGSVSGSDIVIASYAAGGAIATETLALTAATGRTAVKMAMTTPSASAIAPLPTAAPNYSSPTIGGLVALQVQDEAGIGVNNQTVLLSVDRGAIVGNAAFAGATNAVCTGTLSKAAALTTSATNLSNPSGQATPGTINFAVCGSQEGGPGKITITAQNLSTPMPNATASLSQAGRPASIAATVTGSTITARVVDAAGNPAADGTPIRFMIPAAAGALSSACALSANGAASSMAALTTDTASMLVITDYNEGMSVATASTCAVTGARQVSATVDLPGMAVVVTPASSNAGPGNTPAGTATSNTIPRGGGVGFIAFGGGTPAQLASASGCPVATAAFYGAVNGEFLAYVPAAPVPVNASFLAAYAEGIPPGTMFLGKCR